MLTADEITALRDAATDLTQPIIEYLLKDIAERISAAGQFTSSAQYEVWKLQELGVSQKEIKKHLKKLLKVSNAELEKLLTQSAEAGYRYDMQALPHPDAIPFEENDWLQQIVSAAVRLAQDDMTNITQTLGMVDPYGNVQPLREVYRQCMDYAFMQVSTGATDYNTAVRQATKKLAEKGVRYIDYESGVHTSLEAAVRRNIMGGLGLMQEQISKRTHDELEADGWEISAHAASAPDHEPIQGRQYPDAEYEALNNSLVRRIGTLNCGHAAFPIIMGVSIPQYSDEELEKFRTENENGITYNGKHYTAYEATQRQRNLEATIRKYRRKILIDETTGDEKQLQADQIKFQRLNLEYDSFSKAAGLRKQYDRMETVGYNWKQERAAEKAFKQHEIEVANREKYDKMVSEIKDSGLLPKNVAINIPPRNIELAELKFDDYHINVERPHNVTREMAETWIRESKMSATVWGKTYERYYSENGTVYVKTSEKLIRTAFAVEEYDDKTRKIMEVLREYGY